MFLIADVPETVACKGHNEAVRWAGCLARSRNMAIYFPWLVAGSGKTKRSKPPSGAVAGIYARLDNTRGVWKAPAGGEAIPNGIATLAQKVTSADAEKLQGASINAIRKFEGKAIMLWGARTFAAENDAEWKYVNVRRLFLFLERSIEEALRWAVFEPNGENLWAQIRLEISSFLHTAWRAGALIGNKPEDAYFVKCDRTTMTQNDIGNGRLIAMIGVAPTKPAEFVIFRIGLTAATPS
jgi:phage tail sheath protein FI